MKKIVIALIFIFTALIAKDASALVTAEGRYWFTDLSSKVNVSSGVLAGNDINMVDDLGLDGRKGFPEVRVGFNLGSNRIRYGFVPLKWDGSTTLTQTFNFNGQSFAVSDKVSSELKAYYHRLGYEYDFIDTLGNRLGGIIEVKYFDINATVKDSTLGREESKKLALPIPTVGVAGRVSLPLLFSVGGEVTGITLGRTAYMIDGEASVGYRPLPFISVSGGYRGIVLHFDHSDSRANMTVKGPFLALKAEF